MRDYRGTPDAGLIELIRNAFDADATTVSVSFIRSEWDAVEAVVVEDDGDGMSLDTVEKYFLPVGRSWKGKATGTTPSGRQLFGRHGRGRLGAFGLGELVAWTSTTADPDDLDSHLVTTVAWHGYDDAFDAESSIAAGPLAPRSSAAARVSTAPGLTTTTAHTAGTRVVVTELAQWCERLPLAQSRRLIALQLFDYLHRYPAVSLVYDGTRIDPDELLVDREPVSVDVKAVRDILDRLEDPSAAVGIADRPISDPALSDPGESLRAVVEISQWEHNVANTILLADEDGNTLHSIPARVTTPGISYTARVMWPGNSEIRDAALQEMDNATDAMLKIVRRALRRHFETRADDARRALLDEWRLEDSYPYAGEPADSVEAAERELFDIVAVTAAPTLRHAGAPGRQFALRLLKAALQTDASAVRNVLAQVIGLSKEDLSELDRLLARIPLTSMIALQRTATDRIAFCAWLESILNDEDWARTLTERGGLQELIETNVWLFGDDWQSVVSDRGLAAGLTRLRALGMAGEGAVTTVRDSQGRVVRVDLLLSRARKSAGRRQHLIIELKRPSQVLRKQELDQLDNYVSTVVNDPQFNDGRIDWTFVLVGRTSDEYVDRKRTAQDRPVGLVDKQSLPNGASYEMKVLTWSEIIEDARTRLDFLAEHLPDFPTEQDLASLTELHSAIAPPDRPVT